MNQQYISKTKMETLEGSLTRPTTISISNSNLKHPTSIHFKTKSIGKCFQELTTWEITEWVPHETVILLQFSAVFYYYFLGLFILLSLPSKSRRASFIGKQTRVPLYFSFHFSPLVFDLWIKLSLKLTVGPPTRNF